MPAIAFALAFLGGGSAFAQDRSDFFAEQLKASPVYVSDSITRRIDDADRKTLLREVQAMPFPTFLVVAPDFTSENVYGDDRLALVRDALGRDGLYVVSDDRGRLDVSAYGVQLPVRSHDIFMATSYDLDRDDPGLEKIRYALALARGEPRLPRARRAVIPPSEGGPQPTPYADPFGDDDGQLSSAALGFSIIGVFLAGVAMSVIALERRYRRRRTRGRRPRQAALSADVRTRAVDTHARLARDLDRRKTPSDRAVDLEVAASMALERRKPIDDLGALVLAQRGREALAGKERERCFFDPRHAGWAKPTRWQADRGSIEVPACKRCTQAIAAGKAPESLWDGDRPYWQRDTVWARTGFGALRRDMRRALAEDRR